MIKIQLTEKQRKELEQARRIRTSNLGQRAFFVLLSDDGKECEEIAQ